MPVYSVSTVTATLGASTAYSAIEIKTPSSTGIKVVKWWVELNGLTSSNANALAQVTRFTAAVTTNTAATPVLVDYGENSLASQCTVGVNATAEGAGTPNAAGEQHSIPQNAGMTFWEPDPYALQVAPSAFFRLRIVPGSPFSGVIATCGVTWIE
jgi:hypothetical protein